MKKLLNVFIVVMLVMFGFQSNVLAVGTDTNVCFFAEYNNNYNLNGTNCTMVKIVYPKAWTTWYLVTSTNLNQVGGGWYFDTGSLIRVDPYLGLPRHKTLYIKNYSNELTRVFKVSTNSVYNPF
jgi:hypothetical protein